MQHKGVFTIQSMKTIKAILIILSAGAVLLLSSCGSKGGSGAAQYEADPADAEEKLELDELEAEDLALFMDYDEATGGITLMSVDNGRSYTVSAGNLTAFEDNYGRISVPELFEMGMIVDATVSVHSRMLKSLQQEPEAFVRRDVTGFSMNLNRGVFSLSDGTNLRITDRTVIIKDDKLVKPSDITDSDTLLLRGMEHDLYTIVIMSGYGHLRIKGSEYFTGGWVEIAGMFKPVTDDMLLDVPEGEYDMVITYKGRGGTKHVAVNRGRETSVDVSDLKGDLVKTGELIFTIRPIEAVPTVKIDGEKVDHLEPVSLEYGVYQLEVSAEGYATIKEKISVGAELANLEIELTEESAKTSSSSSGTGSSSAHQPYRRGWLIVVHGDRQLDVRQHVLRQCYIGQLFRGFFHNTGQQDLHRCA